LWFYSCTGRPPAAEVLYREAESLFRAGSFRPSLETARQGIAKWPAGDWAWKFRLLAAEDLTKISRTQEARTLLEAVAMPSSPGLLARWKMDEANISAGPTGEKLLREALPLATASGDLGVICMVELYLGEAVHDLKEAEVHSQRP